MNNCLIKEKESFIRFHFGLEMLKKYNMVNVIENINSFYEKKYKGRHILQIEIFIEEIMAYAISLKH